MTQKNYWNDPNIRFRSWEINCPTCRSMTKMLVEAYPHGPHFPTMCPICGGKLDTHSLKETEYEKISGA